jgi:2-haloacid dehalogenase
MSEPAFVFDIGNVLIDWDPRYLYQKLIPGGKDRIDQFLQEIHFTEWNTHQDRGRSFAEGVSLLCAQYPQYAELIRAYDERYEESIAGAITGTVEILRQLKRNSHRLFGLSNWPAEKFALVRPQYAFFDLFEQIIISGEVGMAKPEPGIFSLTLERIKLPAMKCIFIDDSARNIAVAIEFGFNTIQFTSPIQLATELRERGLLTEDWQNHQDVDTN